MTSTIGVKKIQYPNGTDILTLDSSGTLAIGGNITSPLTITTADNNAQLTLVSTDADASSGPNILLKRNSISPADNDTIGRVKFVFDNDAGEETDAVRIDAFIPDVSDGTEDATFQELTMVGGTMRSRVEHSRTETVFNQDGADLDFRVEGDTETHAIFVQAGSNGVGIGQSSPNSFNVHADNLVVGTTSGENGITIATGSGNSARFVFSDTSASSNAAFVGAIEYSHGSNSMMFYNSGSQRMVLDNSGNLTNSTGSYGTISDETLKENISDANSQWNDVKALKVRKYSMKADNLDAADKIGVIAQELEKSGMNGLVTETQWTDSADITKKETIKTVKYSILYMKAIKALQEAMTRIETLEAKVTALESK